jgi:hypothetical protein
MTRSGPAAVILSLALGSIVAGGLAGCATTTPKSQAGRPMSGAIEQPFRDLSLMRERPVDLLTRVEKDPYALAPGVTCQELVIQIADLDAVLGPDIDSPQTKNSVAADLAYGALRGAISLPFRGVVRAVTGAEKRDSVARRAALAGVVRRSFLKGAVRAKGCAA